ncbi:VOC family protein [Cellulomonas sp.]|uniref:VOC family protein n=1 Tax=Cellulomonas sp. TaxID=40001 RepID=UPI003BAA9B7B
MLADHAAIPVLAVTDMERARAFYEGTLGFTSAGEVPDGVVYGTSNGGFLVYPSAYAGTNKATAMSFQLSGDAFDAEVAALRAAGVEFQTFDLPGEATWTDGVLSDGTMRAAWFADPDGNVLNVETDPRSAAG